MSSNYLALSDMVKMLLRPVVKVCLSVSQYFATPDKNKIVFMTIPDAADNGWHLYRYMCKHSIGKQFVWLCAAPSAVEQRVLKCAQHSGNTVTVKSIKSISGMLDFTSAGFVFLTHGLPVFFPTVPRTVVINLWHGMPIKSIGALNKKGLKKRANFDYTLSTSKYYTKVMSEAFEIPCRKVIECGLPRNDALLSPDPNVKSDLSSKLKFPITKRIVFWLPTYRKPNVRGMPHDSDDDSFLDEWDEGFVERLSEVAEQSNCLVLVKLHPLDSLNGKMFDDEGRSVRFVTSAQWERLNVDLYDALAISSALVTDLSSVLIDYAVTKNRMAVTRPSYNKYSRAMIKGTDRILDCCDSIHDEWSFFAFLEAVAKNDVFDVTFLIGFNSQTQDRQLACRRLLSCVGI